MSSSVTVVYGPGHSVSIKTTPTTTLQAVVNSACEKIPGNYNPESHTLVYNNKTMDLSLTIRFANLPQGAKLTLKSRSAAKSPAIGSVNANRTSASVPPASSSSSPSLSSSKPAASALIKVALQVIGSGRVIGDFTAASTLWDIITSAENRSNRVLNLTKKFRVPESGSLSPAARGLNYLTSMLSPRIGNSGSNSEAEDNASSKMIYQQPVLVLMNKEFASTEVMQSTTLRSLGFTGGSVMVRLSFKDSEAGPAPSLNIGSPVTKTAGAGASAGAARNGLMIGLQSDSPTRSSSAPVTDTNAKIAESKPEQPSIVEETSVVDEPSAVEEPSVVFGSDDDIDNDEKALLSTRQVRVYTQPQSSSASLSSRFALPDSFYQDGSSDLKLLIGIQRARQAEAERGFKNRIKQEKEEQLKHEQLKTKYPKTAIRFRFPDMVQVQATFFSSERVSELFDFVQGILAVPQTLKTLVIQLPVVDLDSMRHVSLFDAKLTPAAVVHVRVQIGASGGGGSVRTRDLLKPSVWGMAESLDAPVSADDAAEDRLQQAAESADDCALEHGRTLSSPASNAPVPAPSTGTKSGTRGAAGNADGPKMPKWFLAGQKRT
ncbi:hypothetical protein LPJ66_000479 [Kickxella alabastrina]|uniref:Uncharacterized protein n=1 Tax=Kickxella alabastrina TaxID=61397 RepID=A0ACC1IVR6_9FUNG|nr:hypothetical protein LPJ66_000479 [Kickxella alabastrina]